MRADIPRAGWAGTLEMSVDEFTFSECHNVVHVSESSFTLVAAEPCLLAGP